MAWHLNFFSLWTLVYEAQTVNAGIDKLINQMLLVVTGAFDGNGSGRSRSSEAGSDVGIDARGEGIFSYNEMREKQRQNLKNHNKVTTKPRQYFQYA